MRYLIKNISKESFKPKRSLNQFDNERKNHKSKSQKIMVITMTLHEIRQAYEDNYLEIQAVIEEMGGEGNVIYHKKDNTVLYRKLRKLQQTEHRLNQLEETLCELD